MLKGEHVKETQAKRSNVEIASIDEGRLPNSVHWVLSYSWHREREVELLVTCYQFFWHKHSGEKKKE